MIKKMGLALKLIWMAGDTTDTGLKVNGAAKGSKKAVKGTLIKVNGCLIRSMVLVLTPFKKGHSS